MTIRTKHISKTRYTRAGISGVIALVMLAFVCFGFPIPSAHAASTGRIFGQLLNGTHKNAPVAGQSVTLQMAQGNTAKDLTSVTTDAQGSYVFPNLATDKTISYALYIRYQGAQYSSAIVTLDTKPAQQLNLTVYDATNSTANIAVVRATLLGIRFMQENGSAHNRDIGSAGGGIVDRQLELLRWLGIKSADSRAISRTLIEDI